jgi:hypothetical protein
MTDKVIYVIGTPNGGTSVVAGVLHHLGVDMGQFPLGPKTRSYTTFEDVQVARFKTPDELKKSIDTRVPWYPISIRAYLQQRLKDANGKRVGVKHSCLFLLADEEPETLPILPVFVWRDLEKAIRAGQKFWKDERGDVIAEQKHPHLFCTHQAGPIARSWVGMQTLREMFPDSTQYYFDNILRNAEDWIKHMVCELDLEVSPEQFQKALEFVNPNLRHF